MTPSELATDEERLEREKVLQNDRESRDLDWVRNNRDKIYLANGLDPNAGGEFTCRKCKGNKTSHYQLQTRSSDEPMTCFITCVNCGHHWRKS